MTAEEFGELIRKVDSNKIIDSQESFTLAKQCSYLLGKDEESQGRELLIRVFENWDKFEIESQQIWNSLADAYGLYPYVDPSTLSTSQLLRYELHRTPYLEDILLHREQLWLSLNLHAGNSIVVSAPTSFGKSLLIEEVVASSRYKNIVIIQPTLALLDETRKKLYKYNETYKIIVSTHQRPSEDNNIFLFTGERVAEYQFFPEIEFFVIDEFYKLSLDRDDDRAITLNQAMYKLLKMTSKFYLLGPSVKSITNDLFKRHKAIWHHTDFSTVAVDINRVFEGQGWRARDDRRKGALYELLNNFESQTLIYCSSQNRAEDLAQEYASIVSNIKVSEEVQNRHIIEWIEESIHKKWRMIECLSNGIAFHHGAIPRHLGSSIVDAFNTGEIQYLFCTSTLIEGVNTTARNVVLYDKRKGRKNIDFFDFKNIMGRSGRMNIHYVGKVYLFNPEPAQVELDIEIPLFSQENAPLELLVQLETGDLDELAKSRLSKFDKFDDGLKEVLKGNAGIYFEGQLKLVEVLNSNIEHYHNYLSWRHIPSFENLEQILDLCFGYLLKPGESRARVTPRQLAFLTLRYVANNSSSYLIEEDLKSSFWVSKEPDENKRIQQVVHQVLNVIRHWFDYRLPKLIRAISALQEYVFKMHGMTPGNYLYLAGILENSLFKGALSIFLDYDVPASAIRKIDRIVSDKDDWEAIQGKLKTEDLKDMGLLPYELDKLKAIL